MKKQLFSIVLLFTINSLFSHAFSQDIGSIFCWHYKEIYGGHDYPFNQSILKRNFPNNIGEMSLFSIRGELQME